MENLMTNKINIIFANNKLMELFFCQFSLPQGHILCCIIWVSKAVEHKNPLRGIIMKIVGVTFCMGGECAHLHFGLCILAFYLMHVTASLLFIVYLG